jgi:hypothetical protein
MKNMGILGLIFLLSTACVPENSELKEKSNFEYPSIPSQKALGCQDGEQQSRTMYNSATVPFGQSCESEKQIRTCKNNRWPSWSGTYTFSGCSVAEAAPCGGVAHGKSQTRTAYQNSAVPYGEYCFSEEQTRTCNNGIWSAWSGTFTFASCAITTPKLCDGYAHGKSQTRTAYATASVAYGQTCQSQNQSRTCNNGTWSLWSGTYTFTSCAVLPAAPLQPCDGVAHGSNQVRIAYAASSVPFGQVCQSQSQNRTCYNGTWSSWSGSYTFTSCSPQAAASCDGVAHGQNQTRMAFAAASVPYGQTCQSQNQIRTCNNGSWSAWNGDYTFPSCSIANAAACDGVAHGQNQTRTTFASTSVPFGQICVSENQIRSCNNGTWSAWSGSYTHLQCQVLAAQDCEGVAHGQSQTRTAFAAATVPYGQSCQSQNQSRTCNNGSWGSWSGTYTFISCSVEASTINPPRLTIKSVGNGSQIIEWLNMERAADVYNEVPPWALWMAGGWNQYFFSTSLSHLCRTPNNILTYKEKFYNNYNCFMVSGGDAQWPLARPLASCPTCATWRHSYHGVYSGHIVNVDGKLQVIAFHHAENKNSRVVESQKTVYYQNTINTDVLATSCASGVDSYGNYRDCRSAYNGFVTMSKQDFTAAAGWGNKYYTDESGPVVWPEKGYKNAYDQKTSPGVTTPSTIIHDGYVYLYYIDTDWEVEENYTAGSAQTWLGIKVARARIDSNLGNNFYNYYNGKFEKKSLPAGFTKENIKNYLNTPGNPGSHILGDSAVSIRFSVAKIIGTNYFLGVEEYYETQKGIALRISTDLVNWSERVLVPGTQVTTWEEGWVHYPVLMNKEGNSNTEIDANGFYVLGTRNGWPTKIKMSISIQ